MNQPNHYGVCVSCDTFNQSQYIKETLNGFTMQQTNFPFVCVIMDDASTDGEQQVLLDYLEQHFNTNDTDIAYSKETATAHIHYARHKTNENCFFAIVLLKENHYSIGKDKRPNVMEWRENSTYFAICEGDDYWIVPDKLQLQFDFLESNPDYGMCYTDFNMYYQHLDIMVKNLSHTNPRQFPMRYKSAEDFVVSKHYVCPPSWMIRYSLYRTYEPIPKCSDSTFVMFTHFLCNSKTYFIDHTTTVYRILSESASHSKNPLLLLKRQKAILQLQLLLIDKYQLNPNTRELCVKGYYKDNLVFFAENHFTEELQAAQKALAPLSFKEKTIIGLGMFPTTAKALAWYHKKYYQHKISHS